MAGRTVFAVGMLPVGVPVMEDPQSMSELPRNNLPVPQLVMLANVAAVSSMEGTSCDNSMADEKEMMELKTVGCSYSDSEDDNIISYDNQNHREVCIIEYPESPAPGAQPGASGDTNTLDEEDEEDEDYGDGNDDDDADDLYRPPKPHPASSRKSPQPSAKRKITHAMVVENAKKKKPFHCKPCNYQAKSEEEFVEHLGTHASSKMMVVNRVEGRTTAKARETGTSGSQAAEGGGAAGPESGEDTGDSKGVIRCERCGYNTNRYDHYIAHLKHHSKEGEDPRVFKCTLCPYTTVSQYHWRKHLRNHFPSKLHTCDQCCYFSDRKSNYIQHIRTHTGVRPFRCAYCNYSSSQKTHLTRHMRTHSGERPFKCDSCNYLAANQHEVTRHARQVHNGPKPLACPYCQYKTADRSNFKKHVELHVNPRQFLCPLCKYAASKKCNLQYHIKSRHSGSDIAMDVSRVKLRVKKAGAENGGESADSSMSKFDESTNLEDDAEDGEDDEAMDKQSSPMNLSVKRSGRSSAAQSVEGEAADKVQKKCEVTPDKEKPQKGKDKVEKKLVTRQKKVEKVGENIKENTTVTDGQMETVSTDSKAKRRSKKQPVEKITIQDHTQTTESGKAQPANLEKEQIERKRSEQKRSEKDKEKEKLEKEKEKDRLKNESTGKEKKSLKPRRTGCRKSEKVTEHVEEAPQKQDGVEGCREVHRADKTKAVKRKAVEALDLSTKPSSAEMCTTKAKRSRTKAANKLTLKTSSSEGICKTAEERPASPKDSKVNQTVPAPVKPKKTRKTNKKTPVLQEAVAPTEDNRDSAGGNSVSPLQNVQSPSTEPQDASAQQGNPTAETGAEQIRTETPAQTPAQQNITTNKTTPSVPEKSSDDTEDKTVPSASYSSGEETPSPNEDCPPPTFRRPTSKATSPSLKLPAQSGKPADTEEDEGIHSSHEGGSDISDSASEGSDDSGLNGAGAGSGKMANDPETPTEEIPTPTELKSHMCIFCDRTFPFEAEYRRHLNRHLVNVYYMDNTAKGGK
ncbi:RE1-silencing transcription factor isoform 2-T2 [Polymixia lowei]